MHALSNDTCLPLHQPHAPLALQTATNHPRPGEAIPTEATISNQYRLSTDTERKGVDAPVNDGLLERQQGRDTFVHRPQFQSSLFRFFTFQAAAGERCIPESRIFSSQPLSTPLKVAQALASSADALLLYPIYEKRCGHVVAYGEKTLPAQSVGEVHSQLLKIPVSSPAVMIEQLARDCADTLLEWRYIAPDYEVSAFPDVDSARGSAHTFFSLLRASSSVTTRTSFSNAECNLSASPTEIFS